ncbi:MAG: NAD-dependent dehydratase [Desulfobacterales bacterium S5133MH4]|nr:MAG: NAD-dependent dehydratase [Desulfobacterales bacterium S5133MH4]
MRTSQDVINRDLEYIYNKLKEELGRLAGKKLLITGGAGFLGYYLVQSILYWNERVDRVQSIRLTVYDNYIRGMPPWLTKLEGTKNLMLVKHNISDSLPRDIDDFQYIIHAASIASPTYYRKYPIETMDANVKGLRFLLEYCRQQKEKNKPVEGFLFFSTSEIYGNPSPENIPTPENYYGYVSCTGPRACYDESKRYGETLCVNFAREYGLPIKIARPFNNYGPGLKITDRRALPDFARDVLTERDIVMLSDGSPTRTFCYVADAIVGYYKILVRGQKGEAYNIGVEKPEISIADLAARVVDLARNLFGHKGKVVRQLSADTDYLADNPSRRCPSIAKARDNLDYNPSIPLDEGLRRSLIWYHDNRDAEEA